MTRTTSALLLLLLMLPERTRADDVSRFVVRLGSDTTSVEQVSRGAARVEVDQVGRAPRVLRRRFAYTLGADGLTGFTLTVTPPGSATPTQQIDARTDGDSLRIRTRTGTAPEQATAVAFPRGTVVTANSSPWAAYESQIRKLVSSRLDSLSVPLYFIGAATPDRLTLRRLGRDSVRVAVSRGDLMHIRIDKAGNILGVRPISGTGKVAATRVERLDVDAWAASFAARETAGAGLGALSTRDTLRVGGLSGAELWIDYGRPSKRGRVIFGDVVPFGELWRTGANAATQFRTDRTLVFGNTELLPGIYTLWTVPGPDGWKLSFNSQTGQWGTVHDPAKDVLTVDMATTKLTRVVERFTIQIEPREDGAALHMDWDTTRASAEFTVEP